MSLTELKESGNEKFKAGAYEKALCLYTEALELGDVKDADKAVIYKNRAMCHIKLDEYKEAVSDASSALEIHPNDPKALYRRCVAFEKMDKLEEAYKDAAHLIRVDPKNTSVKPVISRLTPIMKERARMQSSTNEKIKQMFNVVFDKSADKEKRLQATNNLIVLAREKSACTIIVGHGGMAKLKDILNKEKDTDILQASVRVLACLAHESEERSKTVYEDIGIVRLGQLMAMPVEGLSTSVGLLLYNMMYGVTRLQNYKDLREIYDEKRRQGDPAIPPKWTLDDYQKKFLEEVFHGLVKMLQHMKVSACGRDAAMELCIKTITRKKGVHWTRKFLDTEGVESLLLIAGALKQHGDIMVSEQSKYQASLLLNTVWEDLSGDKEVDLFKGQVGDFFKEQFANEEWESKLEAVRTISMLLQGPFEVGNMILSFEGVTDIMLALATSKTALHQQVAVEAIVHSASKKDKCTGMLKDAVPVLKNLYHNGIDDNIKVRALVGLCKLGSFEGSDASNRPMAEGSTVTLAKACRKFITNPQGNTDMVQWGSEGLAYLSLDADVKEELVSDHEALKSVVKAALNPSPNFMYSLATLFVNITNSTDKQEMVPEMVELAKFSKQHVPEQHPFDKEEYVTERVKRLVDAGILSALNALTKTESKNTREQVSRVLLTIATTEAYRGKIVQIGGISSLLKLALENNTDLGKQASSQTIAKIAITQDPKITFPGQKMYEAVRPLISLLHIERSGLQNFESLMALTNLSSISDSVRQRIVAERGIPSIEHYLFEEHELISRAATECMCNMVMNEKVAKTFEGENDRVKTYVLFCGDDEDDKIVKAASGLLAIISEENKVICNKILEVPKWLELLLSVVVNENPEIQHRGCYLVRNMVKADKEVAEKVLEGQLLDVMLAISVLDEPEKAMSKQIALDVLKVAEEYKIVQKNPDNS